ncbi:hypothetical protein COO60DRAFT_1697673 [Scenedesmus sp. NREL 46B-D3]|nr:hypothetical protein COO60DRAFT_1697673 [Scenedesmus sp. NREL 46B-D3]
MLSIWVFALLYLANYGLAARLPGAPDVQSIAEAAFRAPPVFPNSYEMEYTFSMPYFMVLQPGGLSYPVHVWVDATAESVRIDFRGGIDKTFFIKNLEYAVTPHKYELACEEYKHRGGGPVKASNSSSSSQGLLHGMLGQQVLPDMAGWVWLGPADVDGQHANMWQRKQMQGEKVNTYTFYIAEDGTPIKFYSVGQDYFGGSHYDEYIYEWTSFKPGPVDPAVFAVPDICSKQQQRHRLSMQAFALLPGSHREHKDEAHYHAWSHQHRRQHPDTPSYLQRLANFKSTLAKVALHNSKAASGAADAPGHTLKVNHFADWSREEFDRVMLPKKWKREHGILEPQMRPPASRRFTASLSKAQLPRHLDWRATPADVAVKDQGQCGSCWAFAAVGTMEGAWFVATGEPHSFSEQQLIDCAWEQGPHGCDGGDYQPGFRYVKQAGGVAATQDYPYVGQNDWCKDNSTKLTGHFDGYVEVKSRDTAAVMEALMRHGPLAVGVDASSDEFLLYSEGIYRNKHCTLRPSRLDHAVILVGWGEDGSSGERFWLVKNSWSKLWGSDGYIKIHRGGNDCGIASDAAFADVAPKYMVPGAAERALELGNATDTTGQQIENVTVDFKNMQLALTGNEPLAPGAVKLGTGSAAEAEAAAGDVCSQLVLLGGELSMQSLIGPRTAAVKNVAMNRTLAAGASVKQGDAKVPVTLYLSNASFYLNISKDTMPGVEFTRGSSSSALQVLVAGAAAAVLGLAGL